MPMQRFDGLSFNKGNLLKEEASGDGQINWLTVAIHGGLAVEPRSGGISEEGKSRKVKKSRIEVFEEEKEGDWEDVPRE